MDLCRLNRFPLFTLLTWAVLLVVIVVAPTFAQTTPSTESDTTQAADSHDHDHSDEHQHDHVHDHDHESGHEHAHTEGADKIESKVWWLIVVYSLLISCSSLAGGILPGRIALTHTRMQHVISLVGGLMLGTAIFHLLPHSLYYMGSQGVETVALALMTGVVTMFFLLRAFHFHQHEFPENAEPALTESAHATEVEVHEHDHSDCGHAHHHHAHSVHEMSWVGVFIGLAIHTIIDGIALGASVQAEAAHSSALGLFGLGTFAAIALHKPLDAVSITTLMVAGGWSNRSQLIVNIAYSLLCPLGAIVFLFGISSLAAGSTMVIGTTLAFSAGVFLCISLSDLLPEMEFHSHHRRTLSAALLIGILIAWLIRFLEPAHIH
ncbi:ZIP family metal transporter [Thalassoglobus sp. JC818]|uniref:ZIP family metal transporter n=1 Tax=Thalassoglobus sp. JC818 TaxID=3232136 RepID=UPI00345A52D8